METSFLCIDLIIPIIYLFIYLFIYKIRFNGVSSAHRHFLVFFFFFWDDTLHPWIILWTRKNLMPNLGMGGILCLLNFSQQDDFLKTQIKMLLIMLKIKMDLTPITKHMILFTLWSTYV
jgi:hypothetical protein